MKDKQDYISEDVMKVTLAALLHDIGKFSERARGNQKELSSNEPAFYPSEQFINSHRELYQPYNNFKKFYSHQHSVYTAAFVDHLEFILPECMQDSSWGAPVKDSFIDLSASHHNVKLPESDNFIKDLHTASKWIIAKADRLSAAMDREGIKSFEKEYNIHKEISQFRRKRLLPIVEAVGFKDKHLPIEKLEQFTKRIALKCISADSFFPDDANVIEPDNDNEAKKQYKELFYKFYEELKGLKQFRNNMQIWFEQFDNLYMRYAGQIPAATVRPAWQDVSLYDHSRMTAAFATALYTYHKDNNTSDDIYSIYNDKTEKFILIRTDFYGIQKFIFSSGGSTSKAAAKILRGRSFYVSLFSELLADLILRELGLPITSVIMNAAGQVTIIAPNTINVVSTIEKIQSEVNEWLVKNFFGITSLGIGYVKTSPKQILSDYKNVWLELSNILSKKKFEKYNLAKLGGVQNQFFDTLSDYGVCKFCGKNAANDYYDSDSNQPICNICYDQIQIGAKLVKSDVIAFYNSEKNIFDNKLKIPIFGKYQVWLGGLGEAVSKSDESGLCRFFRLSLPSEQEPSWRLISYRGLKGYVPVYSKEDEVNINETAGTLKSFEEIAKSAINSDGSGVEAIAVLKADIDNLGTTFAFGLHPNLQNLTRASVLSRYLNNFFTTYLPKLLKAEFPNIYTVFAGGDDLFLIGPWNKIIELAPVIRERFSEYVCKNPDITISMGISIHKPHEPVSRMAEYAEHALEMAKDSENKNAICIFGETVEWNDFNKLNDYGNEIKRMINHNILSTSLLYKFNESIEDIKNIAKAEKPGKKINFKALAHSLSWKARLKYSIIRNNTGINFAAGDIERNIADILQVVKWLEEENTKLRIPLWKEIYERRTN